MAPIQEQAHKATSDCEGPFQTQTLNRSSLTHRADWAETQLLSPPSLHPPGREVWQGERRLRCPVSVGARFKPGAWCFPRQPQCFPEAPSILWMYASNTAGGEAGTHQPRFTDKETSRPLRGLHPSPACRSGCSEVTEEVSQGALCARHFFEAEGTAMPTLQGRKSSLKEKQLRWGRSGSTQQCPRGHTTG